MIWRSVVGKLWATILLLVSFVLLILTFFFMEYFQNYHLEQTEKNLTTTASKIAVILEQHENLDLGLNVAWELVDEVTKVVIITDEEHVYYSPNHEEDDFPVSYFKEDQELSKVFTKQQTVKKQIAIPFNDEKHKESVLLIGVPLEHFSNQKGAVFIYQSLDVMKETMRLTTKVILLAALLAFVLTTVFAFFLLTRVTSPLKKMKEAAFEVARGKFETKVPILTNDEIGELATAFNQMGKRLKINMNALRQEKEQLSSILSSMADGVITFNRDGTILITNPPADRFLQLWYYEQNRESLEEIPPIVMELFQKSVQKEEEQIGEITVQGRFFTLIVSPLYNNENIRGAVVVLRDMTEERRLDKLRKDFIANVSHELRTPISMLQGYSEALLDDLASNEEERKEMTKIIYEESFRMGRLVNELLDLARMEAGHITLNESDIPLKPFIERAVLKFHGLAKEKNIHLYVEYLCEENAHFYLDPDRMEQVLTNLIDNAIRHTPSEGSVKVVVNMVQLGLQMEVSDTGSGIPEEDLPFIFERFYKADKARKRGSSGTGLGLAIAKNIVEAHKGEIHVRSKLGQGTTFSIFIPRNN
jgi:two-component system, OmpR family, sensor histidine kinase ResE